VKPSSASLFAAALLAALLACAPAAAADREQIPDPQDDRFFLTVLADEDRTAYEATPEDRKLGWRRAYWGRVDPTPTTDDNPRESEHQMRVRAVIERFRDRSGYFIWDDRARGWIRFGPPSEREFVTGEAGGGSFVPPREIWRYEDMVFLFEDRSLSETFLFGLSDSLFAVDRAATSVDVRYLETSIPGMKVDAKEPDPALGLGRAYGAVDLEEGEVDRLLATGAERWRTIIERNEYETNDEDLPFQFDVATFDAGEGKTEILVPVLLSKGDLAREPPDSQKGKIRFERRAAIRDDEFVIVERSEDRILHDRGSAGNDGDAIVTGTRFTVDPGSYEVALRMTDLVAGSVGVRQARVDVPDYRTDAIRLSDLLLASRISRSFRAEAILERMDHRIIPRASGLFAPGEAAHVYFEIYNVQPARDGRHYYEITYRLEGLKGGASPVAIGGTDEGRIEPGSPCRFEAVSRLSHAARFTTLDTSGLEPGRYTLVITARDLSVKQEDETRTTFEIRAP